MSWLYSLSSIFNQGFAFWKNSAPQLNDSPPDAQTILTEQIEHADGLFRDCINEVRYDMLEESISLLHQVRDGIFDSYIVEYISISWLVKCLLLRSGALLSHEDLQECLEVRAELWDASPGVPDAWMLQLAVSTGAEQRDRTATAISLVRQFRDSIHEPNLLDIINHYETVLPFVSSKNHPKCPYVLLGLSKARLMLFCKSERVEDVDAAILDLKRAKSSLYSRVPLKYACLVLLCQATWMKHLVEPGESGLNDAMRHLEEAMSEDSVAIRAFDSGTAIVEEFRSERNSSRLGEGISLLSKVLHLRPTHHPNRSSSLAMLATALQMRFSRDHNITDLNQSIIFYKEALELIPRYHGNRSTSLNNLAEALSQRHERTESLTDLDECIIYHRQALDFRPPSHSDRPMTLTNLAKALSSRFERSTTPNPSDLDEAIAHHQEALRLRPAISPPDSARSMSLHLLAIDLFTRFERAGVLQDLEESILSIREALAALPEKHPARRVCLSRLAINLCKRFERSGELADLEDSIAFYREVLMLRTSSNDSHVRIAGSLTSLADALTKRFGRLGGVADLEESIALYRKASVLLPSPSPERPTWLKNLGILLWSLFLLHNDLATLQEAITLHRGALKLVPANHPDRLPLLDHLAIMISSRFRLNGDRADLGESISLHREVLDGLQPTADQNIRSKSLNLLALGIWTRFELDGNLVDLEKSIALHREASTLLHTTDPALPNTLQCLGNALSKLLEVKPSPSVLDEAISALSASLELKPQTPPDEKLSKLLSDLTSLLETRFDQRGDPTDLTKSIAFHRKALALRSPPHPDRLLNLNNLAIGLINLFKHQANPVHLEEAIALSDEALKLAPPSDQNIYLSTLGNAFWTRFTHRGQFSDLEESIRIYERALNLESETDFGRSTLLVNLGTILQTKFEQTGNISDLEKAIVYQREVLKMRPAPHPDRSSALVLLANSLFLRAKATGSSADLDESISSLREALESASTPHQVRQMATDNLGVALSKRFLQQGNTTDLEESIVLHREAMNLGPTASDHVRVKQLANLANALWMRFEHTGLLTDLEESLASNRAALDTAIPETHPDRPKFLSNLAVGLRARFEQTRKLPDLEESVTLHKAALEKTPPEHTGRPVSLDSLATALSILFDQKQELPDLEESISTHREALRVMSASHSERPRCVMNLATTLLTRFKHSNISDDLEESTRLHNEALALMPSSYPTRSMAIYNLARASEARFVLKGNREDLETAFSLFREAVTQEPGPLFPRLNFAKTWADAAQRHEHPSEIEAYRCAIALLPRLTPLNMNVRQRQEALLHARELACNAARCAIEAGELESSVVFLSTGRSVFWSQALQLRTPLDSLEAVAPDLAKRLRAISFKLERAAQSHGSSGDVVSDEAIGASRKHDGLYYHTLAEDWHTEVENARKIPGFEDFLRPKSFSSLQRCAVNGPVILLNANQRGCDALILTMSGVKHVPLSRMSYQHLVTLGELFRQLFTRSEFSYADLKNIQKEVRRDDSQLRTIRRRNANKETDEDLFRALLEILWIGIVEPVISALGFKKSDSPPRLWWCPTGPFVFLPIHAAGIYKGNSTNCLSEYAISSYCSTLQDPLPAERPAPDPHRASSPFKMLAVIEPEAPGLPKLPSTLDELDRIQKHLPQPHAEHLVARIGRKESPNTAAQILSDISSLGVRFAHFGCHGACDAGNPLESYLLLSGGRLTVSRLVEGSRSFGASLAYLGACQTAVGNEQQPDEPIHLVATMLFAGFSGVVGTMWSIYDQDAPLVADEFYKYMFRNGLETAPEATDAACAVHLAVRELRKQGREFRRWVPFVHFGI